MLARGSSFRDQAEPGRGASAGQQDGNVQVCSHENAGWRRERPNICTMAGSAAEPFGSRPPQVTRASQPASMPHPAVTGPCLPVKLALEVNLLQRLSLRRLPAGRRGSRAAGSRAGSSQWPGSARPGGSSGSGTSCCSEASSNTASCTAGGWANAGGCCTNGLAHHESSPQRPLVCHFRVVAATRSRKEHRMSARAAAELARIHAARTADGCCDGAGMPAGSCGSSLRMQRVNSAVV